MSAYYNENDPKAAAWLRELIQGGHIAPGVVDERSIVDVRADELYEHTQHHFFAGIGGWSLALRLAGWPDHLPVWTGSCPCQPFSAAGKGRGKRDPRHLWPAFRDLIEDAGPAIVFGEQVASKTGRGWLAGVRADLEALDYALGAADLCAPGVGAPHIRQRLWWMAYSDGGLARDWILQCGWQQRQQPQDGGAGGLADALLAGRAEGRAQSGQRSIAGGSRAGGLVDAHGTGCGEQRGPFPMGAQHLAAQCAGGCGWDRFDVIPCADGKARRIESGTFPLAHGIPGRVGLLRGYGNAIVPALAAQFIAASVEALMDVERE